MLTNWGGRSVSVVMSWMRGTRDAWRSFDTGMANAATTSTSAMTGMAMPVPRRKAMTIATTAMRSVAMAPYNDHRRIVNAGASPTTCAR